MAVQQIVRWYPKLIAHAVLSNLSGRPHTVQSVETDETDEVETKSRPPKVGKQQSERNRKRWEQLRKEYYQREEDREKSKLGA